MNTKKYEIPEELRDVAKKIASGQAGTSNLFPSMEEFKLKAKISSREYFTKSDADFLGEFAKNKNFKIKEYPRHSRTGPFWHCGQKLDGHKFIFHFHDRDKGGVIVLSSDLEFKMSNTHQLSERIEKAILWSLFIAFLYSFK